MKSGLHLAYDGLKIPLKKLVAELAQTIKPKLFITTGTAGGIGKTTALGDIAIADRDQMETEDSLLIRRDDRCHVVQRCCRRLLRHGMTVGGDRR